MPQIGWFEIIIILVLAILIIGPKDFPIIIKKIGSWTGAIKRYFYNIQKDFSDVESSIDDELSIEKDLQNITDDNKDNE